MTRDEAKKCFDKYIDEVYQDGRVVNEFDHLKNDLGLDSMDTIELIIHFEVELSRELDEKAFSEVETVSDVLDVIVELTR